MPVHPGLVRQVISPLLERMCSRNTFAELDRLDQQQWWSADRIRALQARKLTRLLQSTQTHCAYYRRRFDDYGIRVAASEPFEQLHKLPLLDKPTIRHHLHDMTNYSVPGGPIRFNTGGSTGEPLVFYVDRDRIAADKAARMLTHAWHGVRPGVPEIYLWGSPIELRTCAGLKSLRDWMTNERLFSAFRMDDTAMRSYWRKMRRIDPMSIFGYPSSLAALASYLEASYLPYPGQRLLAVFTTGEVLEPVARSRLVDYFQCRVVDGYGSRDGGFIAHECEAGRMHVVDPHVLVELIDDRGRTVSPGESGELVITHLHSHAMPMLRYRTGDMAVADSGTCPCGRSWRTIGSIQGRRTDHLVASDGSLRHALSAIYVVRDVPTVEKFCIHQYADRRVRVDVVPTAGFAKTDQERIRRGISAQLGTSIPVEVRLASAIDAQASGKFRYVISEAAAGRRPPLPTVAARAG